MPSIPNFWTTMLVIKRDRTNFSLAAHIKFQKHGQFQGSVLSQTTHRSTVLTVCFHSSRSCAALRDSVNSSHQPCQLYRFFGGSILPHPEFFFKISNSDLILLFFRSQRHRLPTVQTQPPSKAAPLPPARSDDLRTEDSACRVIL